MLLFWKKKNLNENKSNFNLNENNLMTYQWNFIKQLFEMEIKCK